MRESVDNPACWCKAAYWAPVPAKSIFIHPVDYMTAWQGCPHLAKAKRGPMQVNALNVEHGK